MGNKLEPKGTSAKVTDNPDLQNILGEQAAGGEQEKQGGAPAGEAPENKENQTKPTGEGTKAPEVKAPEAKAPEAKGNKNVTFYTRRGDAFDSKTGKPRPVKKHVVTWAEWLRIKDRLASLGYTLVKVEE